MQTRKLVLSAVLIGAVSLCSFAFGRQSTKPQDDVVTFRDLYIKAKSDDISAIAPLFDAYAKLPGNAAVTKQAARSGWVDAEKGDNGGLLVIQVMQNQKIIEQNARIIELLEKSAKK